MIVRRHLGPHTYVLEDDLQNRCESRLPSVTGKHLALERHLSLRKPNPFTYADEALQRVKPGYVTKEPII